MLSLFGLTKVISGCTILLVCISSSNVSVLSILFTEVFNQELSDIQQRGNVPERAASLIRFREKRKERNYEKKVRYNVRKQVALRYEIHDSLYIPLTLFASLSCWMSCGSNKSKRWQAVAVGIDAPILVISRASTVNMLSIYSKDWGLLLCIMYFSAYLQILCCAHFSSAGKSEWFGHTAEPQGLTSLYIVNVRPEL